jgi:hypothetical protein
MAALFDVLGAAQLLPPLRQRDEPTHSAALRHFRAEHHQSVNHTNFVFNCPYNFTDRYEGQGDFFNANADIEPDRVRALALRRTNFIPDIAHCGLRLF